MILDVIDEAMTPNLSVTDRMILVLFDLGITNKPQIMTITGWSRDRINEAIKRIRKKGGDKWLRSWQPRAGKPFVYSLGPDGHKYARELRGEFNGKNDTPPKGQVWHFLGVNQILCRLLEAELEVNQWLSGRESASWLWNTLRTRDEKGTASNPKTPLRPDAMVEVGGQWFMVEFDNATETPSRLSEKFGKYLDLSLMLNLSRIPMIFVTVTEKRVSIAETAFERAFNRHPSQWDQVYFMKEKQEVEFLRGWKADSGMK